MEHLIAVCVTLTDLPHLLGCAGRLFIQVPETLVVLEFERARKTGLADHSLHLALVSFVLLSASLPGVGWTEEACGTPTGS